MLRDIYKKFITEKGIYIGFYEYTLLQENLSIKTEKQINRVTSNIDSIISNIVLEKSMNIIKILESIPDIKL